MKRFSLLAALLGLASIAVAQSSFVQQPNCQIFFHFTTVNQTSPTSPNLGLDNRTTGCSTWNLSVSVSGFSSVTVTLESAPDNNGVAGTWVTFASGTIISPTPHNANPIITGTEDFVWITGFNPWVRVKLTAATGVGSVNGSALGWNIPSASTSSTSTTNTPVDCSPAAFAFTTATPGTSVSNLNTALPCRSWEVSYDSSGFSALSIQFETSPDNASWTAVPNTPCSSSVPPPCMIDGTNPSTTTGNQTFAVSAYGKFIRPNVTSVTGSGTINVRIFGYKGLSARVRSGGAGGGNLTIAGNTNQTAVSGAGCIPDNTGTCTIKLANPSVTINAATGNIATPGAVAAGVGGPNTGAVFETGVTDGKSQGFSVNDTAGVSVLYLMPATAGAANQALYDTGAVSCPTLAAGAPAVCHQLAWTAPNYQTVDSNGSAVAHQPTINFISGTNATVTCVNNAGANRTDCTVAATAGSAAPTFPVNAQTSTYQLLAADFSNCKTIAVASGTFTITAVASGTQPASGACVWIINYGSGVVTFARSGQNINGAAANLTIAAGSSSAPNGLFVVSDGTNYVAATVGGSGGGGTTVTFSSPYIQFGGNSYGPANLVTPPPTSAWVQVNFGTSSAAQSAGGALTVAWQTVGAVDNTRGYVQPKPGATYTLTVKCENQNWSCGIMLFDSGSGKLTTYFMAASGIFGWNWTNATTFTSRIFSDIGNVAGAVNPPTFWLKVQDNGVNEVFSVSPDNITYIQISSRASGTFLTPDNVGICPGDLANSSGKSYGAVTYIPSFLLTTP